MKLTIKEKLYILLIAVTPLTITAVTYYIFNIKIILTY